LTHGGAITFAAILWHDLVQSERPSHLFQVARLLLKILATRVSGETWKLAAIFPLSK
jgi:hypothetical protein